jgi:hypothetical protein
MEVSSWQKEFQLALFTALVQLAAIRFRRPLADAEFRSDIRIHELTSEKHANYESEMKACLKLKSA